MSAREVVSRLLDAALAAVDPHAAVLRALRVQGETLHVGEGERVELGGVRRVRVIGAGKAAPRMAAGVCEALGARVDGGVISTRVGQALAVPPLDVWEAGHPLPDAHGLASASEALRVARAAAADELLICLLSGGASALWAAPPDGVSLGDLQRVTDALLRAGAPIAELNAVRKHLSRIAGGRLARAAAPARVVTLAISDVVGAPPDTIGSGPTVPDPTTFATALEVLRRHEVDAPPAVLRHLQAGLAGEVPETVKPGEPLAASFHLVAQLDDALRAAARAAEELGFAARIVSDRLEGEARGMAAELVREARRAREQGDAPCVLLWGGETTVTVRGDGRGGRNQELALAAARLLEDQPGITLASVGTDGIDGPTDAAGAIVDGGTLARARAAGLHPDQALERNDSYPFLRAAGDLLITGPTGTNVGDVVVAVVEIGNR